MSEPAAKQLTITVEPHELVRLLARRADLLVFTFYAKSPGLAEFEAAFQDEIERYMKRGL